MDKQMRVIEIFKEITKIPNCSKQTEKLREYIYKFARAYGSVESDYCGNILVTIGNPKVCLQAHYDMVCIETDGCVEMIEEKNIIKGNNTTLGADNGVAVAMMLRLIEEKTTGEYLFTNDEEIGLIGANNLELEVHSKKILNLDEEREGVITIGCAGGFDAEYRKLYERKFPKKQHFYELSVEGLPGGHSGIEIHKDIPNALKLLINHCKDFAKSVYEIKSGERHNAIPRSATMTIGVREGFVPPEHPQIKIEEIKIPPRTYSKKILDILSLAPHGVLGWMEQYGLPSKSVNMAIISFEKGELDLKLSYRGMSNELLKELKDSAKAFGDLLRLETKIKTAYDAWQPEDSEFSKEVASHYPNSTIEVIHAGLEGAVLKSKFPEAEVVAIGPNIHHPHTINEYAEIDSILRVEEVVRAIMK